MGMYRRPHAESSSQVLSEGAVARLESLHRDFIAQARVPLQHIRTKLRAKLVEEIPKCIEGVVAHAQTPADGDAVLSYLSAVLEQPTVSAAKKVEKPAAFGMAAAGGTLAQEERDLRRSFARLAALEALRMHCETADLLPWRLVRGLQFCSISRLDLSLEMQVACPVCDGTGCFTLRSFCISRPEEIYIGHFECERCGHLCKSGYWPDVSLSQIAKTGCACKHCVNQRGEMLASIRQLLSQETGNALHRHRKFEEALRASWQESPSREEMRRDWELNKNDVNKVLREIVNLKPVDSDDFFACVEKYLSRRKGDFHGIERLARHHGLIYLVTKRQTTHCTSMTELLAAAGSNMAVRLDGNLGWLPDKLVKTVVEAVAAWLTDEASMNRPGFSLLVRDEGLSVLHGDAVVDLLSPNYGLLREPVKVIATKEYVLNSFFFDAPVQQQVDRASGGLRVFRSQSECNAFHRIQNEFPGCIVVPNHLLKRLVNLGAMKNDFTSADMAYLSTCEVDFAICDDQGYVILVEELQRGDHHNNPEWIRKDALKRRALDLANIPFRESF